jgi:hypothetical protein
MLIDAPEIVCAAMHVKHYSLTLTRLTILALVVVFAHLNPLRLQHAIVASPLPPLLASNLFYALRA